MNGPGPVPVADRASLKVRGAPRGVLARGDEVRWRGGQYLVAGLDGMMVLLDPLGSGEVPAAVLLSVLTAADDFAVLDAAGHPLIQSEMPDFAELEGIPAVAAESAQQWQRAVIEVDTGLPLGAPPGVRPRPAFDPAATTFIQRYQAKAAEMSAVLGRPVSWQTVQAKRLAYCKRRSVVDLVDGRSTKRRRLYGATDARVVEQLLRLVDRQRRRADAPSDARKLFKSLRRVMRAAYGVEVRVPAEPTLYKLLGRLGIDPRDWGSPRGARAAGRGWRRRSR
ncbi:hypothetical protein ACH4SK_38660 [Streptomyces inhibens]|uniref:hypothetical protein n=1 Tax=Streptomyces inhibens TaxID=2293571 RepID=UPI0037A6D200